MKGKKHLTFETDNLAFPEVHVHHAAAETPEAFPEDSDGNAHLDVKYDNLAVPEIVTGVKEEKDAAK